MLEQFGTDLTEQAAEGKLDPVIGREQEIGRLMQILSRRTKNNPCLVGEPGVGKTAVIEGLAQAHFRADWCRKDEREEDIYHGSCQHDRRFQVPW